MDVDLTELVDGVTLLRLRPGDKLAVRFPAHFDIPDDDLAEMRRVLKEAWPDLIPVFFTGDVELTVIRPDD